MHEESVINAYSNICCQSTPSISVIRTPLEEYMKLLLELIPFYDDARNYLNSIRKEPKRLDLITEYFDHHDPFLKSKLNKLAWVIYNVDWKILLDPFNIEKLCSLLDINLTAENIYGKEKLFFITNKYSQELSTKKLIPFPREFIGLEDFSLLPQQEILKYRIHYVYTGGDDNEIVLSKQPIDHATAQLLHEYYNNGLSIKENEIKDDERIFYHEYSVWCQEVLENKEYIAKQKKLIENKE